MANVSLPGLAGFRAKVAGTVGRKLAALGGAVAAEARRLAPVDTGELRSKIGVEVDAATLTVRVVASAKHSLFVEFGTSRNRAQPYLRPALAQAGRLWRAVGRTELAFPNTPEPYGLAPERRVGLGRAQVTIRGSRPFGEHPRAAPVGRAR